MYINIKMEEHDEGVSGRHEFEAVEEIRKYSFKEFREVFTDFNNVIKYVANNVENNSFGCAEDDAIKRFNLRLMTECDLLNVEPFTKKQFFSILGFNDSKLENPQIISQYLLEEFIDPDGDTVHSIGYSEKRLYFLKVFDYLGDRINAIPDTILPDEFYELAKENLGIIEADQVNEIFLEKKEVII